MLCSCGKRHILVAAMSHAGMDGTSGYRVMAALLAHLGALAAGAGAAEVARCMSLPRSIWGPAAEALAPGVQACTAAQLQQRAVQHVALWECNEAASQVRNMQPRWYELPARGKSQRKSKLSAARCATSERAPEGRRRLHHSYVH